MCFRSRSLIGAFLLLGSQTFADGATPAEEAPWPNPARLEREIEAFEESDSRNMPPEGAIVSVGSSSMGLWNRTINEDLEPLTIIPRGFGGSTMYDAVTYMDRIVLNYKPRAILLYEGDNDIAVNLTPRQIRDMLDRFIERVHAELPETRIYVFSIKPCPLRWSMWPAMQEANDLFREACDADPRLFYVDVSTPMLQEDGEVQPDLFWDDKLHMNRKGYEIWRDAVRPVLIDREAPFETQ